MTARTYRSAAYLVALILIAVVALLFASSRASAASGGGIAWQTTTTTSSSESTTSSETTTQTTETTTTETTTTLNSTTTSSTSTIPPETSPPQTHPPVTPPPTSTDAASTTTDDNGSITLGRFLVIFGTVGLFVLVGYLLYAIRDAEQVRPYKKWEEYQAAANTASGIPIPPDRPEGYGVYFEVDTPGVEIKGPITLVDPPNRGTET